MKTLWAVGGLGIGLLASGGLASSDDAVDGKPAAWEGTWAMVNDEASALVVFHSDGAATYFSLNAGSNFGFGCAPDGTNCRHAGCQIDEVLHFVSPTQVQQDIELPDWRVVTPGESCRLEATLLPNATRLHLAGDGCDLVCNYAGLGAALNGDYRRLQQPSFDCQSFTEDRLQTDEKLICMDAELAGLDRDLAAAYKAALSRVSGAASRRLVAAQKAWLQSRGECHDEAPCLASLYKARLRQLSRAK